MVRNYTIEKDGQIDFFQQFQIDYENYPVLIDNTDGIWKGNILEFKLDISNPNKVLFQAIKYLSRMRIKGESVPANILLISLNTTMCYVFHSQDYFDEIHTVYVGVASAQNDGFEVKKMVEKLDYSQELDALKLKEYLKENNYMKIKIDEDCIVGWAERYYRENPNANKGDFIGDEHGQVKIIGEIREPIKFKDLILPYTGKSNEKFKYLMDKLNDRLHKKVLGAFYTPIPYCEKAAGLVRDAINRVPYGNDYIILDRCAGTGNLESVLSDDELSHCVLSTYEYYEYKVLLERLGDKVRAIIPPIEAQVKYSNGFVSNANALSKEFLDNEIIKQYIDDKNCTIILFENPPYSDDSASTPETKQSRAVSKNAYVADLFKDNVKSDIPGLIQSKDIANLFIWSGFHYYLRQDTDSYILFSPIKYWKTGHLVNKTFMNGYLFNREYFHAGKSAISCIYWGNKECNYNIEQLNLEAFDIKDGSLISNGYIEIKKAYKPVNQYLFDKREFSDDELNGVWCGRDGYEDLKLPSTSTENIYNKNILGYLHLVGFAFDSKNKAFVRTTLNLRKNGFYLRKDNYLNGLPLFCAKSYPQSEWYHTDIYSTTADGGDLYTQDKEFLKQCLIYSCLSQYNHCISFNGSDGRYYKNELCFDSDTIASRDLKRFKLNDEEVSMLNLWNKILVQASKTKNYKDKYKYGVYQIIKELNTFVFDDDLKRNVYDYPELNGNLETLKSKLKDYYIKNIIPNLFKYQLLK